MKLREQYEIEFKETDRGLIHYSEWLEVKYQQLEGLLNYMIEMYESDDKLHDKPLSWYHKQMKDFLNQ